MTKEQVVEMIGRMNVPFAYDHFAEGESPDPPFLVYLYPQSDNFAADGVVYYKRDRLRIELYTDKKDDEIEDRIESFINLYGIIPFLLGNWCTGSYAFSWFFGFCSLKRIADLP